MKAVENNNLLMILIGITPPESERDDPCLLKSREHEFFGLYVFVRSIFLLNESLLDNV